MSYEIRTDLALESREVYLKASKMDDTIPGIEIEKNDSIPNLLVTKVAITSEEGATALKKPMGTYITIESEHMNDELEETDNCIVETLSKSIKEITHLSPNDTILVVGLGNQDVTPDSLGPKVVRKLQITRHLLEYAPEILPHQMKAVSAIVPGVLGTTGIETSEIVKGIVEKIHPSLVIVIDALSSKSMNRISKTIQISNSGIIPGSGVGNSRFAITQKELNVPVIVVGVPTVVGIPTIVEEAISSAYQQLDASNEAPSSSTNDIIEEVLKHQPFDCMVTPNDIDDIVNTLSNLLAEGINVALNG